MGDMLLRDRQTIGAAVERELVADAATGSTLVDAALTEGDDFWNGAVLKTIRGAGPPPPPPRPARAAGLSRGGASRHAPTGGRGGGGVKGGSLSAFPAV